MNCLADKFYCITLLDIREFIHFFVSVRRRLPWACAVAAFLDLRGKFFATNDGIDFVCVKNLTFEQRQRQPVQQVDVLIEDFSARVMPPSTIFLTSSSMAMAVSSL